MIDIALNPHYCKADVSGCPSSELYNMDCIAGMKHYPDKYFDLAIVDPPYKMQGNTFVTKSVQFTNGLASATLDGGNVGNLTLGDRPTMEYFTELYRVSKNQIVFGMQYFVEFLIPHQCVIIWDKNNGTNRFSDAEIAWTSFDTAVRIVNKWIEPSGRIHPTQKPIRLYQWILDTYAKKGDKILDTHVGSGTNRISCYQNGFNFVGFEIDKNYFEQSDKFFNEQIAQGRLSF